MDAKVKMRLQWVQLYRKTGNASVTCRRCGISRPTLPKWSQRYEQQGLEGLQDQSRRPQNCPPPKVLEQHRQVIKLKARELHQLTGCFAKKRKEIESGYSCLRTEWYLITDPQSSISVGTGT